MDENRLLVANRAREAIDGAIEVGELGRLVQMVEPRPQIGLRVIRFSESANGEQSADGVREAELVLKLAHH